MAVSFDPVEDLRAFRAKDGIGIRLATDPGKALGRALGLVHTEAGPYGDAFFPTKILLDRENRVLWAHGADDLRIREGPDSVLKAVDAALP